MPRYDYVCRNGHKITAFRQYRDRLKSESCHCGEKALYQFPLPSRQCDGIYSYAPNVGDPKDHERRMTAIEEGRKVIDRSD